MALSALPAAVIKRSATGISFQVRLTPKAGRDRLEGWTTGANDARYLKARVAAPPEKGKANANLVALFAHQLHIPKSAIVIAAGESSRLKTIEIRGDAAELAAKLELLGEAK